MDRPSRCIRVLYVMRVVFVLRSIEVYPAFVGLVSTYLKLLQVSKRLGASLRKGRLPIICPFAKINAVKYGINYGIKMLKSTTLCWLFFLCALFFSLYIPLCNYPFCQRPYCVEYTRSHPNSAVNRHKARSVLGWGTAWEALRVPLTFHVAAETSLQ